MFESPTNPVTKVADIERLVELAHRHGALAVMDNTFAGFHQHGEYDVDLFVHSLTKYASGTGDVMGGAVIGRHELIEGMRAGFLGARRAAGSACRLPDPARPQDLLRALPRTDARRAGDRRTPGGTSGGGARALSRVSPGHPQAALAQKQMREAGTVVTLRSQAGQRGRAHASAKP